MLMTATGLATSADEISFIFFSLFGQREVLSPDIPNISASLSAMIHALALLRGYVQTQKYPQGRRRHTRSASVFCFVFFKRSKATWMRSWTYLHCRRSWQGQHFFFSIFVHLCVCVCPSGGRSYLLSPLSFLSDYILSCYTVMWGHRLRDCFSCFNCTLLGDTPVSDHTVCRHG